MHDFTMYPELNKYLEEMSSTGEIPIDWEAFLDILYAALSNNKTNE